MNFSMRMRETTRPRNAESGFTLIELILATAISAIVIGILSACLSFSLRAWESSQNRRPDQTILLVDLLKKQLAEVDPTPIKFEDGMRPLFSGNSTSIVFATSHSVKAISQGIPVAVRYSYDAGSKTLFYAERPLDPYHSKLILDFAQPKASGNDTARSFTVDLGGFSLAYAGKDEKQFSEGWNKTNEIPIEILLTWNGQDSKSYSQTLMLNCPFAIQIDKSQAPALQTGGGVFLE